MSDQAQGGDGPAGSGATYTRTVDIINKKGMHARASAKFVRIAEQLDARITVSRGTESVGGTSIMGLMMLAAGPGTSITISATGPDAEEAVEVLCGLISTRFGEDD